MTLMSCKYVLIACLFGLVPFADRAHADPVNVPGMERVLSGGKAGGVNDRFSCPGLATDIWNVLISREDMRQMGKELDEHFGFGEPVLGPVVVSGKEWFVRPWHFENYPDLAVVELHQAVSKIDSSRHPDSVLRLHVVQHLAEECVLTNGEASQHRDEKGRLVFYDGYGDYPLKAARCDDFNTTRAAILDCAEKAIDAINARHDWNVTFQRNE